MKCQYCEKPATFHITELVGPDGPSVTHLCEEHARKYLSSESPTPLAAVASALAKQLKLGQTKEELAELDRKACPVCGITFYEFRNAGRLGCPFDYTHFRKDLEPLLANIHDSVEHIGKRPKRAAHAAGVQGRAIQLRREMEDAVEHEDYERASVLRDQLRALESGDDAGAQPQAEQPDQGDR